MTDRAPSYSEADEEARLRERVAKLEWWHEQVDRRLAEGAESFSELRRSIGNAINEVKEAHDRIKETIAPKPTPWARIAGLAFAMFMAVTAWLWQLAQYPTKDELSAIQSSATSVAAKVQDFTVEQALLKEATRRLEEAQARQDEAMRQIVRKIDSL